LKFRDKKVRRLQSSPKFKFFEFTILAAMFLLNSTCLQAVLADEENAEARDQSMGAPAPSSSEARAADVPTMAAPVPGDRGGASEPASSSTPASAETPGPTPAETPTTAPVPTEVPSLAPAQSPTLAPGQPASAPVPPPPDLVPQTPQMAIDPVLASSYSNRLGKMEEIAFGASYAEHELNDRIDHLEEELFKSKTSGSPDVRITKLELRVFGQSAFTGGSQAPIGAGYLPFASGPAATTPTMPTTPIASASRPGVTWPPYSGGNAPPVIIPGVPFNQPPSSQPVLAPQTPQYQQPTQQPVAPKPTVNTAPPYAVQSYQGTPYSGNGYYPNQSYGSQGPPANNGSYGYANPYGNQNYQQRPSSYLPPQSNPYQYGAGTQPYSGQGYQQYQPYRQPPIQQPSMPQQPYTQPYQQYPSSQYPPAQYPSPSTQTLIPPEVTPVPVQTPSSKNSATCEKVANSIPQSAKDGDYFANIRHFAGSTTMHWQTFPVIVHLPKDSPDSWRRALEGDLKKWGQYLPLSIAKADEKAKVDVQFVNKLPAKILGVTRIDGCADDLKVTVFVLRPTFYPSEIPENVLQHVFAHELGHALGLLGHSTNSADVMYIHDDKQDKSGKSAKVEAPSAGDKVKPQFGSDKLSGRDLNTLKKLYMSAPLPSGFRLEQPLEYSTTIFDI
jgi:predicted Zn-dependent protease